MPPLSEALRTWLCQDMRSPISTVGCNGSIHSLIAWEIKLRRSIVPWEREYAVNLVSPNVSPTYSVQGCYLPQEVPKWCYLRHLRSGGLSLWHSEARENYYHRLQGLRYIVAESCEPENLGWLGPKPD